ncbi:hypothetical protein GX48_07332 [Paracoccidioides brasiliensis]|nr:hypothetical protein GX48_07332 [Paracoccidioides brasiliensis]
MSQPTGLNKVEDDDEMMKYVNLSGDETNGDALKNVKQENVDQCTEVSNRNNGAKTKVIGKTTTTPRKRGRKPVAEKNTGGGNLNNDVDESPTKRQRVPAKAGRGGAGEKVKAGSRPMPTSLETASPEDKMLLRMKDEENKPWADIRQAWEEMTCEKVGNSSLSGRYSRIKANFVVFKKEDEERLLRYKKEIEEKFEADKWRSVAEAIESNGGEKYPPTAVQKKFKELSKKMSNMAIRKENDVEDS